MKTTENSRPRWLLFVLILVVLLYAFSSGCKRSGNFFCDNWDGVHCTNPQNDVRTYKLDLPEGKSHTYFDLAYYMYFHSRQTPGLRVNLKQPISAGELQRLRQDFHCVYRIEKEDKFAEGKMEGIRFDANGEGFWCFDYLGSMLVNFHKKYHTIESKPVPQDFPMKLTISYDTGIGLEESRSARIGLHWKSH